VSAGASGFAVVGREESRPLLRARLALRAPGDTAVAGLRVTFCLPGWTPVPAFADVGGLAAGEARSIGLELALGDVPGRLPTLLAGAAWLRWERGTEGRGGAVLLDVAIEDAGGVPEGTTR
jgi:hypothetical protein